MFRTVMLGSNDIARSRTFYDATMPAIGCPPGELNFKGALAYRHKGAALIITKPLDGEPATVANGGTVSFEVESEEQVREWHAAGIAAGGTAIEDPPGLRTYPTMALYSGYLRDPDGHKLCVMYPIPA